MKKKKLISSIAMGVMATLGIVGLAGCDGKEPPHTHLAQGDLCYCVEQVEGVDKVFSYRDCSCGEAMEKTLVENGIVATTENFQTVLDGDMDNKIVVFKEGTYNDVLNFRPTYETARVYSPDADLTDFGADSEVSKDSLSGSTLGYKYLRSYNNITFYAEEGAEFKNLVRIDARHIVQHIAEFNDLTRYDAVRKLDLTGTTINGYHSIFNMNNITFKNMKFTGTEGRIWINMTTPGSRINNVTIEDCQMSTETAGSHAGIYVDAAATNIGSGNLIVRNNVIDGHNQGVYMNDIENVEIVENTIKNTEHNAIACHSYEKLSGGNILIERNNISNTIGEGDDNGERALRFGSVYNANIVIKDNVFEDATDGDGELMRATAIKDSVFTFKNNTNDGVLMNPIEKTEDLSEYVVAP